MISKGHRALSPREALSKALGGSALSVIDVGVTVE
jgi:hypothetical protein